MLIWTEVVCEGCSATTAGEFAHWGKRSAAEIKRTLQQEGWCIRGKDFLCPDCKVKPEGASHE